MKSRTLKRIQTGLLTFSLLAGSIFSGLSGVTTPLQKTYAEEAIPDEIVNPDFETGDLTGWTTTGDAFSAADVSMAETYWTEEKPFKHQGKFHVWGFQDGGDDQTGTMESTRFRLAGDKSVEGSGRVSFLIGGGSRKDEMYVALVRASDGQELFKATGPEDEAYTRVTWDASAYIGETLFFRVVDNAVGGFGHLNVDDFRSKLAPPGIVNPDFETGDLTGWTVVEGDAFNGAVTSETHYWDGAHAFEHHGKFHLWGFAGAPGDGADARNGVLESSHFQISGNGQISFLVGGGDDIDKLYVALVRASDGAELFKATGKNSETYSRVTWDAKGYLGDEAYIKIVDRHTGGFGHINLDDFRMNMETALYSETFRPQIHYSPEAQWMNDPNGLVYYNGEYHMFYQYSPSSTQPDFGRMHWGHAVSTDLVHWEELSPALAPDANGAVFSGSVVVDQHDTTGFFDGGSGLVAIYTSADTYPGTNRSRQRQSLAYSSDNGRTWTKYEDNPVLSDESITDFRDPKVFWHEGTKQWVMALATGQFISFYTSPDLKRWSFTSKFGEGEGSHDGVWECPDLFELPVNGDSGNRKWVLVVSLGNDDAHPEGSRMQYFIGDFNGKTFTNDNPSSTVLWLDHGRDMYAGVTFNVSADASGRRVMVGWMNNWKYAGLIPTEGWRGAMTLPRELSLKSGTEGVRLTQQPVSELGRLQQENEKRSWTEQTIEPDNHLLDGVKGSVFEIVADFEVGTASEFGFRIRASDSEQTVVGYDMAKQELFVDRTKSGKTPVHSLFPSVDRASLSADNGKVRMHLFVDTASVEVFGNDGQAAITDQIFPDPASKGLAVYSKDGSVKLSRLEILPLHSVWLDTKHIVNPDFENGDLTGWTLEGDAFQGAVTDQSAYWDTNRPFQQHGKYHVWGYHGAAGGVNPDSRTGTMTSSSFVLSGSGRVDFLIGGAKDIDKLYVALVRASDGKILMKETGPQLADFESYKRVLWDATAYLGQELYFQVVDQSAEAHINVDDFHTFIGGTLAEWKLDENSGALALDSKSGKEDPVAYVFNDARYKADSDPIRVKGISGNALSFDGYSTWITRSASQIEKPKDAITISAWVAPRSYEWGDDQRPSAIVNQHDRGAKQGYLLGMYRHGSWTMQLGLGTEWVEAWSEDHPLEKNKWSFVAATYERDSSEIKLYLNGEQVAVQKTPKNAPINASMNDLLIGKNNQGVLLRGTTTLNMFNGLMDEVKIEHRAVSAEEIKAEFDAYVAPFGGKAPSIPENDMALDRSLLADDRQRPQYHLSAPGHWMNEPHAPIYFNGQYHIFYQHNPQGPYWHQIHWGHLVSTDMVHWRDLPVALAPEKNGPDPDGTWSGSAAYDENGIPVLFFTAGNDKASPNQSTGLARSTFKADGNNDLINWVKNPTPVTIQEKGDGKFGEFRDPFVFKDGDHYVQLVGSGLESGGGTALAYTSKNLTDWTYKGPVYKSNYSKFPFLGTVWELPVLLPVGKDKDGKTKYMMAISPSGKDPDVEVYYWLGTWNSETFKFDPDQEEPSLIDVGDYHFTGPSGFVDPKTGRTIMFTVSQGERTAQSEYDAGWAHNGGLPVSLSLRSDGKLGVEPIKELESLRGQKLASFTNEPLDKANALLKDVKGDMLEIVLEFDKTKAEQYGIKVRRSQYGEEETLLYYDAAASTFNVNREKSTLDPDEITRGIQGGKLELNGESLKLHIYLDRSEIEAYANGLKSLTTRAYPSRSDSLGLKLWTSGGEVKVKSMEVWQMNSAYGPTVPAYSPPIRRLAGALTNHDFETGDLTGWTVVSGNTFSSSNVTNRNEWGWDGPFNMAGIPGKYHLWGIRPGDVEDGGTGELRSETFVLGGDGQIDFLVGGGNDINNLYIALVRASDGKVLMKETGRNWEMYLRRHWDASAYIGQELYIKVVDKATGGWGHINIDDVNVPVKIEVTFDTVQQQLDGLLAAGDISQSCYSKLVNKLKQAEHQSGMSSNQQSVKFLVDFLKELDGSTVTDKARATLEPLVNELLKDNNRV